MRKFGGCLLTILVLWIIWSILPVNVQEIIKVIASILIFFAIIGLFSGGGGGTWSGGGTTSSGGTWRGGGTFSD